MNVALLKPNADEAGGALPLPSLARRLAQPELRARETLNLVRRALNVEGFDSITIEEPSDAISLDRERLIRDFELSE